jgi:hypothetical protein
MQQLLNEMNEVIDLSASEADQLIYVFRDFLERNFEIETAVLDTVLKSPANHLLNQQEDEDNSHTQLTELFCY